MLTPDRGDLLLAFRAEDAYRALGRLSSPVPSTLTNRIPHAYDLTLPVDKLANAAKGIGFVSFQREKGRGVVRDIPLTANAGGVLVLQLGLLVATDVLGIDPSSITFEEDRLVLGTESKRVYLPLSEDGLALLNWHVPQHRLALAGELRPHPRDAGSGGCVESFSHRRE